MRLRQLSILAIGLTLLAACTTPSTLPESAEAPAPMQVTTSGHIIRDEIWSGTVHVTGDIVVDPGVTLTILAGTTVLISANSDDQQSGRTFPDWFADSRGDPLTSGFYAENHISIHGKIVAIGTPSSVITFTSDSPSPTYADWIGIALESGSIMEYCIVEYTGNGAINSEGDDVIISHNVVRHGLWCGIGGIGFRIVSHNEIYDFGHEGMNIAAGNPIIAHNFITQCHNGMTLDDGSSNAVIENNTLFDNANNGIWMENSTGIIRNNVITSPNESYYTWSYQGKLLYWGRPHNGIWLVNSSPVIISNLISEYETNIIVSGNSSPIISHNMIINGDCGIGFNEFTGGSPKIYGNNIYDNEANLVLPPGVKQLIDAASNWWGTANLNEIEEKLHHYRDDRTRGKVTFEPFLEEPAEDAGVLTPLLTPTNRTRGN